MILKNKIFVLVEVALENFNLRGYYICFYIFTASENIFSVLNWITDNRINSLIDIRWCLATVNKICWSILSFDYCFLFGMYQSHLNKRRPLYLERIKNQLPFVCEHQQVQWWRDGSHQQSWMEVPALCDKEKLFFHLLRWSPWTSIFQALSGRQNRRRSTWGQFHQHSMSSFYVRRSQKRKKAA